MAVERIDYYSDEDFEQAMCQEAQQQGEQGREPEVVQCMKCGGQMYEAEPQICPDCNDFERRTNMPETAITSLVAFDEIRAGIALYKQENASLEFDYEDPVGEKAARSHVYKLRLAKGKVVEVHKATKAEALAACRAIDNEKNTLIADVEEMINVHMTPIKAIEDRRLKAEADRLEAEQAEKERIEQERLDAIAKREEELKAKEEASRMAVEFRQKEMIAARRQAENEEAARRTKIKAEEDRLAREREKFEAEKRAEAEAKRREEEAKKQAEIDKQEALERAEREKQEAVEAEKQKAKEEAEAKVKAEAERIAAEKAEQERLAEIECERVRNQEHRTTIENEINRQFFEITGNSQMSLSIRDAIRDGKINNVTINY